jgi:methionyl-tRNA formyltransferase
MALRVAFAGTPAFSVPPLAAIRAAGHQVVLVLTQPDRPSGRGMALKPSPVKAAALAAGEPVFQPPTLKTAEAQAVLREARPDVLVVVAYGLILPQAVLDIPARGAINIHASLLPRWRGAAPIHRALIAGDAETGICIMRMDAGLDTGPVLLAERIPITASDTLGTLHDRLAVLGARLVVDALKRIEEGTATETPQPDAGVTYAHKIEKGEAALDWTRPAAELDRRIRAFDPAPGAVTMLDGVPVKIWRATIEPPPASGAPGAVLSADRSGVVVACGAGALRVLELQRSGGKRLDVGDFLAGVPLAVGARFTAAGA